MSTSSDMKPNEKEREGKGHKETRRSWVRSTKKRDAAHNDNANNNKRGERMKRTNGAIEQKRV